MKFIYPAVFRKKEAGGYHAYFPDLECCEADGETLDDAIEKANEACRTWIEVELEEDEPVMPYVSDIEDIEVEDGDVVRNISVNIRFYEGWMNKFVFGGEIFLRQSIRKLIRYSEMAYVFGTVGIVMLPAPVTGRKT